MKKKALLCMLFCAAMTIALLLYNGVVWHLSPDADVFLVKGIDVSNHQGNISWNEIDNAYRFAFIKATEAVSFVDKKYKYNICEAKKKNLLLGAYHFFHFNYGGIEQANNFINTVGNDIDLPPVVDVEFSGNSDVFDIAKLRNELRIMLDKLTQFYKAYPIIYVTHASYERIVKGNFDNPVWMRSIIFEVDKSIPNLKFWQYHDRAKIRGIASPVDLNVFYGGISDLENMKLKKLF